MRCNCRGACSCQVIAGTGISVSGSGSLADPYVITGTGSGGAGAPSPLLDGLPLAWDEGQQDYASAVPYLDGRFLKLAGGQTMTGLFSLSADPTAAMHPATKQYVDANAAGYTPLAPVKAVADSNVALSGLQTIDSHPLLNNERVLLVGQTTGSQNGPWVAHAGAWTRPADFASGSTALAGSFVYADVRTAGTPDVGNQYNGSGWSLLGTASVVVDTGAQAWGQVSATGDIVAGTAMTRVGNTLNVDLGTVAGTAAEGDHTHPGGPLDLGPHTWTGLQKFAAGMEAITAPGSTVLNGVASHLLIRPADASPDANAITVKRPSLGAGGWGGSGSYGRGQVFELLSSSAALTTALGTDPDPTNPVLMRIDRQGGVGTRALHVAPGLRQEPSETAPTMGVWVQPFMALLAGLIIDNPSTADVPGAPGAFLALRDTRGDSRTLVAVNADGTLQLRAKAAGILNLAEFLEHVSGVRGGFVGTDGRIGTYATDGFTEAVVLAPKDNGLAGARAILRTMLPGTIGLALVGTGALAATANFLHVLDSPGGNLTTAIDERGGVATFDGTGTVKVGHVTALTTPAAGYRARFAAQSPGTVALVATGEPVGTATVDVVEFVVGSIAARLSKTAHWFTRSTAKPATADMAAHEVTVFLDEATTPPKLSFSAKKGAARYIYQVAMVADP